ncbi:hypothetical protein EVAR_6206_1 [Eumeta japonica]|uniref:Uncharacterized protein n=1 Tax=Eumeta variegata TaxID=151549 RepID=A0A4C2A2W8_EUMVA|nr:hypothetical protein EVAR_6206_1 [Eumeta japonica]
MTLSETKFEDLISDRSGTSSCKSIKSDILALTSRGQQPISQRYRLRKSLYYINSSPFRDGLPAGVRRKSNTNDEVVAGKLSAARPAAVDSEPGSVQTERDNVPLCHSCFSMDVKKEINFCARRSNRRKRSAALRLEI